MRFFNSRNGEERSQLKLRSDVILLTNVFEKFEKVSIEEFDINPLSCSFTRLYLAMWFEIY